MPDLFVIAGPNGAGKSTYSRLLSLPDLDVYDGDKELQKLQQKFPDIDEAQLWDVVADQFFPKAKQTAIKESNDFAFETNFADSAVMHTVSQFKESGYQTNLIYIGLESSERAIERVVMRVKKGGHDVTNKDILSNYRKGLKNLELYFEHFDRAMIYDNTSNRKMSPPRLIYKFNKGKVMEQSENLPNWALFHLARIIELDNGQEKNIGRKMSRS